MNSTLTKGKIVLCISALAQIGVSLAAEVVKKAGGIGVIFAQQRSDVFSSCSIPCVVVDYSVATKVYYYVASETYAFFSFILQSLIIYIKIK